MRHTKPILALLACLFFFACKKEASNTPDNPSQEKELITTAGTPSGTPTSKTIGSNGGSISSADGRLKLDIPAGALSANQTITIQPITNEVPSGVKTAYRLQPQELTLQKPVTLTMSYTNGDVTATVPEALTIAYQNKAGGWKTINGSRLNKSNKTISTSTSLGKDISLFKAFQLEPMEAIAQVGTNVELKVVYCVPDADLLVPLTNDTETPLTEEKEFAAEYVKKWTLTGEGILGSRQNKALYTAPAQVPHENPVEIAVTLDLKTKGQFILIGRVTIIDEEVIVVTAGGGPGSGTYRLTGTPILQPTPTGRVQVSAYFEGGTTDNAKQIELVFPPQTGVFAWSQQGDITLTYIVRTNGVNTVYNSIFADINTWYNSAGHVEVTRYDASTGLITGKFEVAKSGYANGNKTTTNVTGWFAVRK